METKDSEAFLRRWSPDGPWVLTAIEPDRKGIETATFYPTDTEALNDFLNRYNGKRNIYFHVNRPLRDLRKKAEREDIAAVEWLHVDIDPRAGEPLDEERERALRLLREPPGQVPPPTVIVFSGGGYQGMWRLAEPIRVDGDLEKAEDAKRYNLQLETEFGADQCHNIDRILRLPGTWNMPDARKRKKGREAVLAELAEFHEDREYSLSAFTPAPLTQVGGGAFAGSGRVAVPSGNVERLSDVEDLDEWGVSDRVKVIVVQGHHPDETKAGDNSRSAWLFDATCAMVRAGVPDDVIFSVLTDPDFGISDSVLDKGSGAERYAVRQIERAKEEAVDPWLRYLNERYAVILNIGGRCRVVQEIYDQALNRQKLTRLSFEDFRNAWMNRQIQVGAKQDGSPVYRPVGKWWLEHPERKQYSTLVFAPNKETTDAYNLWKGFAVEARPGGSCAAFLEHVRQNVCSGNAEHYTYLLGWMANAVQHPDRPGQVAVVMRGARGTGKSFYAKEFGSLFGRHYLQVGDSNHLVGNFNAHLRDCVVLFGDEAFFAGDRKHESILKMIITEEMISIESKGVDVEMSPNCMHLLLASNHKWVAPAGEFERRFLVLDVADDHRQDNTYFARIRAELDAGGREALLHYLLHYDLSDFEVRDVPKTRALQEQKVYGLSPEQDWWFQKLQDGDILPGEGWPAEIKKDALVNDYVNHTRKFNVQRRGTETALGIFLRDMVPGLQSRQRTVVEQEPDGGGFYRKVSRRAMHYVLCSLEQARARWEEKHGEVEWPPAAQRPEGEEQRADDPF